ncbi:MAG: 2-oxo acid dehydrogenase subunit E2 [Bacteroidales bacterium]|nr:2-oxo acid dehydrogenase subunit E2 [Bacteroidales bacterium]MCB9028657.1 2-oxo acid dehydrogenase subunit E2 [Bacteroidales bacterium]NLD64474.1 2-oxo acid dehydrogenase subunit E2 [Bacteroidales bacterium]HOO65455.1 dihydrolipoamide acetyltransferase family protein [Bacteroidales bacterium]HPE22693.1 dihydrolipoamide acetyltransferase family protein [Bacteroidales bacterium]
MRHIFKFPDIGEGLTEGIIIEWYVDKGTAVKVGQPLVKMETDKVVTDIPSPRAGVIAARYGKVGETIHVGETLVEIEIEGEEAAEAPSTGPEQVEEKGAGVVGTIEVASGNALLPASEEGTEPKPAAASAERRKVLATPVARAMAREMNIDINLVTGTGPAGRVMKSDIQNFHAPAAPVMSAAAKAPAAQSAPGELIEIRPMTQIRKSIARNMLRSKQNTAHMTLFEEPEVTRLVEARARYKEEYKKEELSLTYLPFIIKAVVAALKRHPELNSEMDFEKGNIIYKNYYNIGIAVSTEDGLVVPVIRDADKLSIRELSRAVAEIAVKARDRKLTLDDMKDGTFTITNYGALGGWFGVPVINYPQVGILGIGRINQQPVVADGEIKAGNVMPLSLSVDHRMVDGAEATEFLNDVAAGVSDPLSLIMRQ